MLGGLCQAQDHICIVLQNVTTQAKCQDAIPVCPWVCQLVKNGVRTEMHLNCQAAVSAFVWYGASIVVFLTLKGICILSVGFLIGYLSYRGRMQLAARCQDGSGGCEITPTASYLVDGEGTVEEEIQGPPVIFWPELKAMLSKKLSAKNLVDNLR